MCTAQKEINDISGSDLRYFKGESMHPFVKNSKENGVLNYIRVLLSISIVLSVFNPVLIASAESVIDVSVSSDKINPGDIATVVISLSNSENITGMNMTLVYDQSIVSLNNVTVNETLMTGHSVTYNGTGSGKIAIVLNGLDSISTAETPVIDVSMLGLATGISDIELQDVEFLSVESTSPAVSVSNGQIRINSTPQLSEIGDQTVNESELLEISLNATDADGDSLSYSTNASFGNLTSNVFSWTPESGDEGERSVSFTVSDGYAEDSENITIKIRPPFNYRPVFDPIDDINAIVGDTVNFTISATDWDNDDLTYYNTSVLPEGSIFYPDNQSFVWFPLLNDTYNVDFGVSDGLGGTDALSVKITVTEEVSVNNAPVFTPIGDMNATESELLEVTLNATDTDGDPLNYSSNVSFGNINGNVFSWVPASSDVGVHYINFSVNDGALWDHSVAQITVYEFTPAVYTPANPVNFISTTGNFWVLHDWEAGTGNVSDGYNVSYGGNWYNTTGPGFNDTTGLNAHDWSNITVYAYNATISTLSSGIEREVQIPNNPISLVDVDPSYVVSEGETLTIDANYTDVDGDDATFTSNDTSIFDIDASTGVASWTTKHKDNGIHYVNLSVSDGYGSEDSQVVVITVMNVNIPPVLDPIGSKSVNESEVLSFTINANDVDNETLTYSANGLPTAATLDSSTGNFSWTPGYDDSGVYDVEFIVTDSSNANDTEEVTITVNNVNRAPHLESIGAKSVNESQELSFTLVGTDQDTNDTLSYSMTGFLSGATLNASTGEFSWTPDFDVTDTSTDIYIMFTVSDGEDSSSKYVIITVHNTNRAPQFPEFATVNASENTEMVLNISAVDPDGDSLSYSSNVSFGTISDTDFVWTPDYNQSGTHYVEFTATDGSLSNTTVVTIDVEDVNRAPVIDDDSVESFYILDVGELVSFNIVASDADGNLITYNVSGLPDSANNSLNPVTGAFSWTPGSVDGDKVFNGVFTVSDGNLTDSVTATFAVDVLNTPPTLEEIDPKQINETENLVIQLNGSSDAVSYTHLRAHET